MNDLESVMSSVKLNDSQKTLVGLLLKKYGPLVKREQIYDVVAENNLPTPWWIFKDKYFKAAERGFYKLPQDMSVVVQQPAEEEKVQNSPKKEKVVKARKTPVKKVEVEESTEDTESKIVYNFAGSHLSSAQEEAGTFIPTKDKLYVPFGNFSDLKSILVSKIFMPVYITGLSGNGKTFMVEQAAAEAKREMIRVNITIETDEDDLLGGFRLVNGETVWFDGPVVKAMKRGAVLLLDEVDLMSTKGLCLQPVLEGRGVYLKKINRFVKPAPGFTIVATANTKGKGSDDGRFVGTNVLNEAFLERFAMCIEQEYPSQMIEKKILSKVFNSHDIEADDFVDVLTGWSETIRQTFLNGGVDELISTRRLVHIANTYAIFGEQRKSIEYCINRFDSQTKDSFLNLFDKLTAPPVETPVTTSETGDWSVTLCGFMDKIHTIKVLREMIPGLGLKEAKDLTEAYEPTIIEKLTKDAAQAVSEKFQSHNIVVKLVNNAPLF